MSSRMRKPEETMLQISCGDWLLVKKHLTAGETRRLMGRVLTNMPSGQEPILDPLKVGVSHVQAYLLDWSILDADNRPILFKDSKGEPDLEKIAAALDELEPEALAEIIEAITTHDAAMKAERVAEKNARAGVTSSPATSASAV
jgi:hypothetical protein